MVRLRAHQADGADLPPLLAPGGERHLPRGERLVTAGLATAQDEKVGRRSRTRYDITEAGHQHLQEWLDEPRSNGFLEAEGLVRVLFSDQASRETLQRTLAVMADDARARGRLMIELLEGYQVGEGEFPRRTHINLLMAGFVIDFALMVESWQTWAAELVDTWPGVQEREPDPITLAAMRDLIDHASPRLFDAP